MDEIAKVQVGSGMYRSGYWLKEVEPDTQGYRLILEQDVALSSESIEAIIELARQFRAMREACRSEREYTPLVVVGNQEDRMVARFQPGDGPAQKVREVTFQIPPGRTMYMAVSTLLRLADTLSRFREKGKLEDIQPRFKPEEGKP
jgi:hypothetical protein